MAMIGHTVSFCATRCNLFDQANQIQVRRLNFASCCDMLVS